MLEQQLVAAQSARRISSPACGTIDEILRAHHVDVGQRAAGERRKAEAEDRADIGLAHVGEHVLLEAARGLQRLNAEQALLQLLDVDLVGIELLRLQIGEARPQLLRPVLPDSRRSPCRSCGRSGRASRPSPRSSAFCRGSIALAPRSASVAFRIFQARSTATSSLSDERADRHAGHAADILDHRRRHAFGQHQMAFADIGADHARGVEAARVVDDDRRLADARARSRAPWRAPRRRSSCRG